MNLIRKILKLMRLNAQSPLPQAKSTFVNNKQVVLDSCYSDKWVIIMATFFVCCLWLLLCC